jgi:hypothetical protein
MITKIVISMQIIFILFSFDAFATIYDYTAIGQFEVEGIQQNVFGNMQISDEFLAGSSSHYFEIIGFELTVTGGDTSYEFSGEGGVLGFYSEIINPRTGNISSETQWGIWNSSGDHWSNPFGAAFNFFTSEMVPYYAESSEYYGVLAPTIALVRPFHASQYSDPNSPGNSPWSQILLTRTPAPVPEPTTMLLFGIGLAGLTGTRFRKRGLKSFDETTK